MSLRKSAKRTNLSPGLKPSENLLTGETPEYQSQESGTPAVVEPSYPEPEPTTEQSRYVLGSEHSTLAEVEDVLALITMDEIPLSQIRKLQTAMEKYDKVTFDEEFNIREELGVLMRLTKSMREHILGSDGRIKSTSSTQEVKQTLDSSRQLLQMLSKVTKEILSTERIRAIEGCFLSVVSTFPKEKQTAYLEQLELRMKASEQLKQSD